MLKDLQRLRRPSYLVDTPRSTIDTTVLFSVVVAGVMVLAAVVVLSTVLPMLSSTLWGPGERLLEEAPVQPVVIPPEFWTTMLEFHREMQAMRAAMREQGV